MKKLILLCLFISQMAMAQGLFESAGSGAASSLAYELNGYVRTAYFAGKNLSANNYISQAAYGETALELKVKKVGFGEAFSDISIASGYAYGSKYTQLDIREAYLKYYTGRFNFVLGKQIVVWGRADAYNPTNMLSMQDMLCRSANEDDRRFGNWMLRSAYQRDKWGLELVWVPVYESWRIPFQHLGALMDVDFQAADFPTFELKESSFAARVSWLAAKIDGSFSYFSGYHTKPAINGYINTMLSVELVPKAYQVQMVGADFQTTIAKYGLRGELAYVHPRQGDKTFKYIPKPDLQWVIGGDRSWGDFMLNMQYMGKWVRNFEALPAVPSPSQLFDYAMHKNNRMLAEQTHELTHKMSTRLSYKLLNESLDLSLFAMYNINTEEYMLRPKIDYNITDAMSLSTGLEYFAGPAESLYGTMDKLLNTAFVELKVSF